MVFIRANLCPAILSCILILHAQYFKGGMPTSQIIPTTVYSKSYLHTVHSAWILCLRHFITELLSIILTQMQQM